MLLRDIGTVFWRDWIVLQRRLGRFMLSRMITPVLYLITFGWGLGRSVQIYGGNYLDFIFPGIIALNSMNISFSSVSSPVNMSRLLYKTLEEYLVSPISSAAYVIGKVLSGTVRGLISSLIIIALGYIFGARFLLSGWFLMVLTLNCIMFSALGFVAAMMINSHEDLANFGTYFLLPMSFLSATFFAPQKLPGLLQFLVEILPLTHTSYALRALAMGGAVSWNTLGIICLYTMVFFGLGWWLLRRIRD